MEKIIRLAFSLLGLSHASKLLAFGMKLAQNATFNSQHEVMMSFGSRGDPSHMIPVLNFDLTLVTSKWCLSC